MTLQDILHLFEEEDVSHTLESHAQIPRSSHEAAKVRGSDVTRGAKALILKADDIFVQVVVPAHRKTRFNVVRKHFHAKRVRLAEPQEVLEATGCVVGSVPPLGVLWDMPVLLDTGLLDRDEVVFSAGTLTESIHIAPRELVRVNRAELLDLT